MALSDVSEGRAQDDLYDLDLSGLEWIGAPGSDPRNRVEIARLPEGAVAMRNSACPDDPPLRYTAAEWEAFILGARDGEFDLK
ncbi:DUF397 domain-containing protein [Streptomyces sp. 769]|uniref:DUF397 domain-containing protein n=1 Tax=Streptomyces sp. 769 TaxID=1262452 RepID=UPI00057D549D|nr:DUF397 domain-containing protein [Streptomyces sp. 769]